MNTLLTVRFAYFEWANPLADLAALSMDFRFICLCQPNSTWFMAKTINIAERFIKLSAITQYTLGFSTAYLLNLLIWCSTYLFSLLLSPGLKINWGARRFLILNSAKILSQSDILTWKLRTLGSGFQGTNLFRLASLAVFIASLLRESASSLSIESFNFSIDPGSEIPNSSPSFFSNHS